MTTVGLPPAGTAVVAPRGRWAWIAAGWLLALAAVGIWTGNIVEQQFRGSYATLPVRVRTFPDPVHTVDLSVQIGNVLVERGPTSTTIVRTSGTRTARTPSDDETLRAGTLHIGSSCGTATANADFCRRNYVVEVPADTAVLAAVGTGNIEIRRTGGSVRVSDGTGSILVDHAAGEVQATADTGQITVVGARKAVLLQDRNGGVAVYGATAQVTMASDTGDLTADDLAGKTVTATAANGTIALGFSAPPTHVTASTQTGDVTVVLPPGGPSYQLDLSSRTGTTTAGLTSDPTSTRVIRATSVSGNVAVTTGAQPVAPARPVRPVIPVTPSS